MAFVECIPTDVGNLQLMVGAMIEQSTAGVTTTAEEKRAIPGREDLFILAHAIIAALPALIAAHPVAADRLRRVLDDIVPLACDLPSG